MALLLPAQRTFLLGAAGIVLLAVSLTCTVLYSRLLPEEMDVSAVALAPPGLISWHIDRVRYTKQRRILVEGWAVKRGEALKTIGSVFLLRTPQGIFWRLPTQRRERPDVTAAFGEDTTNYLHCGLRSFALLIFPPQGSFTLYILYRSNNKEWIIDTGVTL